MKKNPALQDSPPAAGRASDILPFRRSAHPRGAFLSYGNEVSYTIKITGGAYKPHPFTRSIRIRRTCGTSAAPRGRKIHPAHSIRGKVG